MKDKQSLVKRQIGGSRWSQGDHDELKIFLEIPLIPSRIGQKLSSKKGNTCF